MEKYLSKTPTELKRLAAELALKMEKEGVGLAKAMGVEPHFLAKMYSIARTYYEAGHLEAAQSLFEFLIQIEPESYKFTLGLASTLYAKQEYVEAQVPFFSAHALEPHNPYPLFYLSDCFIKTGEKAAAKVTLDRLIALAEKDLKYRDLGSKAQIIKSIL